MPDENKKIAVGIVCTTPPEPCGIGAYFSNVSAEIEKLARVVRIGTGKSNADYVIDFKSMGLKARLAEIIRKEKLDVLHFHYIAYFYGKWTLNLNFVNALSLKIPKVTTLHEAQFEPRGIRGRILSVIERQVCEKSDVICLHTPRQLEFLTKKYRVNEGRLIYYGFVPKPMAEKAGKNLLFFGILSPGKGLEYLIRAMAGLSGYKLRIVGSKTTPECGEYQGLLMAEIEKSPNKADIELITKPWFSEDEKEGHFRWANMVVLSHLWAPYHSGIVGDAGVYGLPIVVTRTGAVWELVEHFHSGEIAEPRNPESLAEAVKKVSKNYLSYMEGIKKYREEANCKKSAEKYVDAYRAAIAKHKK